MVEWLFGPCVYTVNTVFLLWLTRIKALSSKHLVYKINENDHRPPHVHVEGMGASVRINLLNQEVMDEETEFSNATLNRILRVVKENRMLLLERWEELHG